MTNSCKAGHLSPQRDSGFWIMLLAALVFLAIPGAAVPVKAKAPCALALVIAVDVSASVSAREYRQQVEGLAYALEDPEVVAAIEAIGGIWVTSFEWSGPYQQNSLLDWRFLQEAGEISAAARRIAGHHRDPREFLTALGYALAHGSDLLKAAPEQCEREVIDVSADGINNQGFGPEIAYADPDFQNLTVNALVIGNEDKAVSYYADHVIRGPGAFVEVARDYEDYRDAMVRKLLKEIGTEQVARAGN